MLRLTQNIICNYFKEPIESYASRIMIPESINLDKNFDNEYTYDNLACT